MSEALSLDDVARRFADSEVRLTEAVERLQSLGDAEDAQRAAGAALTEAASAVREFSETARDAAEALRDAQEEARRVLEAGAQLLDGSDLRELRGSVDSLEKSLTERFALLEREVSRAEQVEREKRLVEAQLAHIKANVGDRHLRKALETLPQSL